MRLGRFASGTTFRTLPTTTDPGKLGAQSGYYRSETAAIEKFSAFGEQGLSRPSKEAGQVKNACGVEWRLYRHAVRSW